MNPFVLFLGFFWGGLGLSAWMGADVNLGVILCGALFSIPVLLAAGLSDDR